MLVPAGAVAHIIGRGGESVRAIEDATRARIHVASGSEGELNAVSIEGGAEPCETAIRAVWALVQAHEVEKVRDNPYVALSTDGRALSRQTFRMLVSERHAPRIIGKGGADVRALRDKVGANVTVQSQGVGRARDDAERAALMDGERVVVISGPEAAVHRARVEVWHRVCRFEPSKRRGGRPTTGASTGAGSAGASPYTALGPGSGAPVAKAGEDVVSEPLSVPSAVLGRLIGRGGATIDGIRTTCGCAVHVSRDVVGAALRDGNEDDGAAAAVIVTVVGTMAGLAAAKALIARAVAGEALTFAAGGAVSRGTTVPGFVSAGLSQKGSA